jgi:chaperonin cofactor prefoldin
MASEKWEILEARVIKLEKQNRWLRETLNKL